MDEQAFLQAMREQPHDHLPWLAYADWLTEHDRLEEAAFLRFGVAAVEREDAGLDASQLRAEAQALLERTSLIRWNHPAVPLQWLRFEPDARGLFRRAILESALGLPQLNFWMDIHPISEIVCHDRYTPDRFRWQARDLDQLAGLVMRGILTLSLETGHGLAITPEVIERLFVQGPMLPALESVGMDGTCWLGNSLVRLASSPKLPRLRELRLNRCANVDNLSALLESSASHRIRSWHLEADDDASPLAERLLSAPYLDRVEKLHLGRRLTDAMLPRLIHGNPPMNLQQLTLAGTVHDVMVAELAWSPRLERLDSLHFTRRDQPIDATPVIELITSPRATQLRSLAIPFPGVGDVVLDVLIRSAVLPNLESLVISDIAPNREWELYASPMRQKLRKLTIQGRRHVTIRPLTRDFRSSVGNRDLLTPNQSHGADPDLPLTR